MQKLPLTFIFGSSEEYVGKIGKIHHRDTGARSRGWRNALALLTVYKRPSFNHALKYIAGRSK